MVTCKHCGRILTHPVYEYLGEGATCRETYTKTTKPDEKNKRSSNHGDNNAAIISMFDNVRDAVKRDRPEKAML